MGPQAFIVDTNVLVSGVVSGNPESPPAKIVSAMRDGGIAYLLSSALMNEYRTVLLRPKTAKAHGLSANETIRLLRQITAKGLWREPAARGMAPDPGDHHLWDLLRPDEGAILITGDRLLLGNPPDGRAVITPRDYIEQFAGIG